MADERRFTEEEVHAILARAVDLEQAGGSIAPAAGGLSLSELRQVASEAGIDPALVEAAAAELPVVRRSRVATWLGPPTRARATRLLGVALSEAEIDRLVRLTESRSHRHGTVSEALGRVVWSSESAQLTIEVTFSDQDGRTRVDVDGRYPGRMRPLMHLLPGAMGMALAVSLAAPVGILGAPLAAVALGGAALGAALGRGLWELVARTTVRTSEALADHISAAAVDLGSPTHPADDDS